MVEACARRLQVFACRDAGRAGAWQEHLRSAARAGGPEDRAEDARESEPVTQSCRVFFDRGADLEVLLCTFLSAVEPSVLRRG